MKEMGLNVFAVLTQLLVLISSKFVQIKWSPFKRFFQRRLLGITLCLFSALFLSLGVGAPVLAQLDGGHLAGEPGLTPPSNTLDPFESYRLRGDVVTSGVGMRTRGFGTITVSQIPEGSRIMKAYLYWATLGYGSVPSFSPFPPGANEGLFNGAPIVGMEIGKDQSPCWAPPSIHAFRADVTEYFNGNGTYHLSGFADTGNANVAPSIEGASLVILFNNPQLPLRDIVIYNSAETVIGGTNTTLLAGFQAAKEVNGATLTMIVADGQTFGALDDQLLVNGVSFGYNRFDGDDGPNVSLGGLWDNDSFDVTSVIPPQSSSLDVTLASRYDPTTYLADCLTWIVAILSVPCPSAPPTIVPNPLKLFISTTSGPNSPFGINYSYVQRTDDFVIADVTITNLTGTWFEVGVDFASPSPTTSWPIGVSEGQIPYAFLVAPFGQKTFRKIRFQDGEYLHFNATKTSLAAVSVFSIDLIGRGIFGVELPDFTPGGFINLSVSALPTLFGTIKSNCGGEAAAIGACVGLFRLPCVIEHMARFMQCTVQDENVRRAVSHLITNLYGSKIATKWIEFGAKSLGDLLFLLNRVPKIAVLTDQWFLASPDGFMRLEAR